MLHYLCIFYKLSKPPVIYYCDNKGVIKKIHMQFFLKKSSKSQDILKLLEAIFPPHTNAHHVKAHQDKVTHTLTQAEYLNTL